MPEYHPGHGHREQIGGDPRNRFKFMRPDDTPDKVRSGPLIFEDRLTEPSGSTDPQEVLTVYNNPYASLNMKQQRARLPIYKNREHILYLCEKYRTIIIVGETGCGKSTQIPQYLLEAGWTNDGRMVGVTQPRRVAVVTLASRVAEEKGVILGQDVGYTVRFDDVTDDQTKIKFMTDGILLRELLTDPLLSKYSVIMIDEAHERTCNSDILLGLLRKVLIVRPDLRILVSSATLDAELFRDFFELNESNKSDLDTSCIMSVEGRTHPVAIYHTKTSIPNYIKATVDTVLDIHKNEIPGDILVFLTGQEEVIQIAICSIPRLRKAGANIQQVFGSKTFEFVIKHLSNLASKLRYVNFLSDGSSNLRDVDKLWIVPCYGSLPPREQVCRTLKKICTAK
ncbi:putative ATP-dependent RNA helicase DHX35 [Parelaphostrongylus tenuis]|uniref:ATP-dependent RNA helicase DHX35 n=1 Tax=Parelaphostrongylus tenuis TaxID=148309 RepID=A0AAD5R961_PARTN|nr:putative ATP-dependent RNA helicase DHX35 [Parelaphostrongylus tenuis]